MNVVTDIQRTVILAEKGFLDALAVRKRLSRIKPFRYPPWLVVGMIGLSCAAFSRLAGGDAVVFALTFIASATGMRVRQLIAHRHFNPFFDLCRHRHGDHPLIKHGNHHEVGK